MKLQVLTREAFAPFGQVIEANANGDRANQGLINMLLIKTLAQQIVRII